MKRTFRFVKLGRQLFRDRRGGVFVEYLLLLTLVGIGTIAGLATVRGALLNELLELASAIAAITP
jgi:Flp pilus assembly pilin Flp